MAVIHGKAKGSVRYHFYDQAQAWKFAQDMVACGRKVTDFGYDATRTINKFWVDVA